MMDFISIPTAPYRILAASAVAVPHTGNTTETILAEITIPAGAMGTNGYVEVDYTYTYTNSANNKTIRVRASSTAADITGSSFVVGVATTTASMRGVAVFRNRNSAASQVCGGPNAAATYGSSTTTFVTTTLDTTAPVYLVITGLLANSGETITLEHYTATLIRPS